MSVYSQSGDIEGAIETYEKAIELKPDFAAAFFNLGTAHEHAGDLSKVHVSNCGWTLTCICFLPRVVGLSRAYSLVHCILPVLAGVNKI